ncbi:abnormal pharyngeal pumping eat-20 [Octopus bimaculoides]|uniref:EGF-like domain-containing protein n=1 Tax=Octopus bimaculoides TaxID=37653 RepID=A0A0L8GUK0_OCTBM|nr:abnormal pharyngeal pumping eat-20 [Octopus bimaculoides]|eukprot:XP_014777861.1 PREDICTED: abnormal pharyngeal pumping eat-20-like [Octopus bimaculoides]
MKEAAVLLHIVTLMACLMYINTRTLNVNNNITTDNNNTSNNNIDDDVESNTKIGTSESPVVSPKTCTMNSTHCGSDETCVKYNSSLQCRKLSGKEQYFCSLCVNGLCDFDKDEHMSCYCKPQWTGEYCSEPCLRDCTIGNCIFEGNEEYCECPGNFTSSSNCTKQYNDGRNCGTLFNIKRQSFYTVFIMPILISVLTNFSPTTAILL